MLECRRLNGVGAGTQLERRHQQIGDAIRFDRGQLARGVPTQGWRVEQLGRQVGGHRPTWVEPEHRDPTGTAERGGVALDESGDAAFSMQRALQTLHVEHQGPRRLSHARAVTNMTPRLSPITDAGSRTHVPSSVRVTKTEDSTRQPCSSRVRWSSS